MKISSNIKYLIFFLLAVVFTGCTSNTQIVQVQQPEAILPKKIEEVKKRVEYQQVLKRKVAIARFGNEAQYGKSALFGLNTNYNAETQATDILSAKLTQSEKFILLERKDLDKINKELDLGNIKSMNINADYLILGSVTEFGRKNSADVGVFSRTKKQTAYAKVSLRIVDVKSGQVIFAQEGSGDSESETGTAFGLGTQVSYDSTLNDKAISAAISAVVDGMINKMLDKPWKSYILSKESNDALIIAGGKEQGLKIGDEFRVMQSGKSIKNPQTGMIIELPGKQIATIKVLDQFGTNYNDEGSICTIVDGFVANDNIKDLYVQK